MQGAAFCNSPFVPWSTRSRSVEERVKMRVMEGGDEMWFVGYRIRPHAECATCAQG